MGVIVTQAAAPISSNVRPVDCVSQKGTSVMVTMIVETTPMKPAVEMVNVSFDCDE